MATKAPQQPTHRKPAPPPPPPPRNETTTRGQPPPACSALLHGDRLASVTSGLRTVYLIECHRCRQVLRNTGCLAAAKTVEPAWFNTPEAAILRAREDRWFLALDDAGHLTVLCPKCR